MNASVAAGSCPAAGMTCLASLEIASALGDKRKSWTNFLPNVLRHVPEHDALIAVAQEGELLRVYDVLSAAPFDLQSVVPRAITQPIARIELGFSPQRIWPSATPAFDYTESPLFVRGDFDAPTHPFKFPMLGQT